MEYATHARPAGAPSGARLKTPRAVTQRTATPRTVTPQRVATPRARSTPGGARPTGSLPGSAPGLPFHVAFRGADIAGGLRDQSTQDRITSHDVVWPDCGRAPGTGTGSQGTHNSQSSTMTTTSRASQDLAQLLKATRRQSQPARRQFAKCLAVPEDEVAVIAANHKAQEEDWRRILRRQRGVRSDIGSSSSWADTATAAGVRADPGEARPELLEVAWEARLRGSSRTKSKSRAAPSVAGLSYAGSAVLSAAGVDGVDLYPEASASALTGSLAKLGKLLRTDGVRP